MRLAVVILLPILVLLPSCKRSKPVATSSSASKPASTRTGAVHPASDSAQDGPSVAESNPPAESEAPDPPGPANRRDEKPAERPGEPPNSGTRKEAPRNAQPDRAAAKGKMIIRVYGTALDFDLDALTWKSGTYRLSGRGINFVGRMSQNVRAGQLIAIEPRVAGVGESELDLPQVGKTKVISGRIKLDEVIGQSRIKGRISFSLQGPDGPSSFEGTFEVGIVSP